jgi:hypothetical protein
VDGTYFKGGQIFVKLFLERKRGGSFVVGVDAKLRGHASPCKLLLGHLIVSPIGDDVIEDLKQIKLCRPNLRFGI